MEHSKAWVGFDLDGTAAFYTGWRGPDVIGDPVGPIVSIMRQLLKNKVRLKIVTARFEEGPVAIKAIEAWCQVHLGQVLEVTDKKDGHMVYLFDDRAIAVEKNTGQILSPMPLDMVAMVYRHTAPDNPENPDNAK